MAIKKVTSLFDQLAQDVKATVATFKAATVKNRIQRKFESAHDDASDKIADAQTAILEEQSKMGEMNINTILGKRQEITTLEELQVLIKDEYKILFNEEIRVRG